jgi:hypothetical protein
LSRHTTHKRRSRREAPRQPPTHRLATKRRSSGSLLGPAVGLGRSALAVGRPLIATTGRTTAGPGAERWAAGAADGFGGSSPP